MARKKRSAGSIAATDDTITLYAHLLLVSQDAVKSSQRSLTALAKEAGQHGVSWSDVKSALKEYETPLSARRSKVERMARIFDAIGVPAQLELFDAYEAKHNDAEGAARRLGRLAAVCSRQCTPPYPAGSIEGQAWIGGWHEVQRLVADYRARVEAGADAADEWDEKPVASVNDIGGVDYDPDKVAAATNEAVATEDAA